MKEFKRTNRRVAHKGHILDFCEDEIITAKGHTVYWDFLKHKGAAAIVPVMDDGKIIMVRQWRNAIDRFSLEIPAGGKDSTQELTKVCAARELEEETGFFSKNIEFLQTLIPAIAYSGEKIDVYVAFDLKRNQQNLDPEEDINLETYTIEQLIEMIKTGEIEDAKTISALTTYYLKYINE